MIFHLLVVDHLSTIHPKKKNAKKIFFSPFRKDVYVVPNSVMSHCVASKWARSVASGRASEIRLEEQTERERMRREIFTAISTFGYLSAKN